MAHENTFYDYLGVVFNFILRKNRVGIDELEEALKGMEETATVPSERKLLNSVKRTFQ